MSTGQTLLALGAIALFMYLSMNINRGYVAAAQQTTDQQTNKEAVNYGQTLAEQVYSTPYQALGSSKFKDLDDKNNPSRRIQYISATQDTFYATVDIQSKDLIKDVTGKMVTITVYIKNDGSVSKASEYEAAVTPITSP